MVMTCFSCQNLLSDYLEEMLPSSRNDEVKRHIESCKTCSGFHQDLVDSLKILREFPREELSSDFSLELEMVVQSKKAGYKWRLRSMAAAVVVVFVILLFVPSSPVRLPTSLSSKNHMVRYYPLLQGAGGVIEEQASWLHSREPMSASLWEEGGLSPEEFEKTFQLKAKPEKVP